MVILVLSDSHGEIKHAKKAIEEYMHLYDFVIHLGDYTKDANRLKSLFADIDIHIIAGNCDIKTLFQHSEEFEIEDKRVYACHGNRLNVKYGRDKITYFAEENKYDLVLFGHTHEASVFKMNDITYINPGSISNKKPSFALVEITSKGIEGRIIEYK